MTAEQIHNISNAIQDVEHGGQVAQCVLVSKKVYKGLHDPKHANFRGIPVLPADIAGWRVLSYTPDPEPNCGVPK